MLYKDKTAFINRKKEFEFLTQRMEGEPQDILFIYGPKSSGKTTLLYNFVKQQLGSKGFDVKFFNLREILICNYKDFIRVFFEQKEDEKTSSTKQTYDLKVFKVEFETLQKIESNQIDPFSIMKKELEKKLSQGIKPLIIIDELQALSDIYMNGQRELLKELFNFFVAITKESHLCNVIISSSDGYFIEKLYSASRLLKTSTFLEIDYLVKNDVVYWLNNLEKESGVKDLLLTNQQIERIWHYFGGSVWEIRQFISTLNRMAENKKVKDEIIEQEAQKTVLMYKVRFEDFYARYKREKVELLRASNELFNRQGFLYLSELKDLTEKGLFTPDGLYEELGSLVSENYFSYNPESGQYKAQGHSVKLGLEMFCRGL
jgi:uncharacterized protein